MECIFRRVVRQNVAHYTKEISFLLGVSSAVWDCRLIRRSAENGRRECGTGQRRRQNNISGTLLCNRITVVQAAESRQGLNLAFSPRANCCWPTRWGVLRETQVRSIIVVIEHVLGHQPFEMPFI